MKQPKTVISHDKRHETSSHIQINNLTIELQYTIINYLVHANFACRIALDKLTWKLEKRN